MFRIPERFLPGKFDIWFQSHQVKFSSKPLCQSTFSGKQLLFQIFHVLVIAAAFVHYHGMADMAVYR